MLSKSISKLVALVVICGFIATAVPMTTATNITPASIPEIPIGKNVTLTPAGINAAREYTCGGFIVCAASTNSATGNATLNLVDNNGPVTGEQAIAYAYKLVRACNGQSTTKAMTIRFNYGYTLDTEIPLLVQNGAATATIQARARSSDPGVSTGAVIGSSNSATYDMLNVVINNNTVYETGLGGRVTGAMTNTPLPNEVVTAFAEARLGSVQLNFHDLTDPTFNYTRLDPPAQSPSGDFLGYVNTTSVVVKAQPYDPTLVTGVPVGQSCVATVTFSGDGQSSERTVDYFQNEVQSDPFTGDGEYNVAATAIDNQGNDATRSLRFIIDSVAPDTEIGVFPTQLENGGKNGWYKAPAPKWNIKCHRNSNPNLPDSETAPCKTLSLSEDGGATYRTVSSPGNENEVDITTTTGASVQGLAKSTDYASNVGNPDVSDIIKVDILKSTFSIPVNRSSEFSNGWYREAANTSFLCTGDDISGCGLRETSLDNGATWTTQTYYECPTDEVDLIIDYGIEDMAGNRNIGERHFGCDFTLPTNVPYVNLTTPTVANTTTTNQTPTWTWPAQSDPFGPTGVRSGLRGYEVFLNDNVEPYFVDTTSFTSIVGVVDIEDGQNCITVRSLDNAGNRGTLTDPPACIFVDRVAPEIKYNLPARNTLYFEGQALPIETGLAAGFDAVVVGGILAGATVTDKPRKVGEDVSKVDDVELIETIVLDGKVPTGDNYYGNVGYGVQTQQDRRRDGEDGSNVPCENVNVASRTCSWSDFDGVGELSVHADHRRMYVRAWDNAQNRNIEFRNYTRVTLGPYEMVCNQQLNQICTRVFFDAAAPTSGIVSYQLHRGTDENFVPSVLNQIGPLRTALDPHYVDDTSAEVNKVYYYKLVATGSAQSLTSLAVKMVTKKQVGNIADYT